MQMWEGCFEQHPVAMEQAAAPGLLGQTLILRKGSNILELQEDLRGGTSL